MRRLSLLIVVTIMTAACQASDAQESEKDSSTTSSTTKGTKATTSTATSTTTGYDVDGGKDAGESIVVEEYPDLALREFWRAMAAPRPVEGSAMPPKHFNEEWFPETLVDRHEIVPGGPPPDGIPSIDEPVFATVDEVDDIGRDEAVLVLRYDDEVRVYPVRIMLWHEIVNDVVAGTPITITYCPLCNSAIAYDRTVDGRVLDFGTSGYLYRSGMVMYDRQTESLWTHFDGRAVVGSSIGAELDLLPVATVSWAQASEAHPDAQVLRGDPDDPKPYGTTRYVGYDQADEPLTGWFNIDIPEPVPPMTRVVGVRADGRQVAVPTETVAERGVVRLDLADLDVVLFHQSGTASPLQTQDVGGGDDIGSTGVFDPTVAGDVLEFRRVDDRFIDTNTSSVWNIRGQAIVGPMVGTQLTELEHLDTFWFAWVAHHPDTGLVGADG